MRNSKYKQANKTYNLARHKYSMTYIGNLVCKMISTVVFNFCKFDPFLSCTVIAKSRLYFVLLYYSHKSWYIFKTRDRFVIWRFQNTHYMCNLTKFWLRYLRLKKHDTILLFSWELIWLREKLLKSEHFLLKSIDKTS